MRISRRRFMSGANSGLVVMVPGLAHAIPLGAPSKVPLYRPGKVPSERQIWEWQIWTNNLGPRYTGNPAHTKFVEFLASNLQSFGLDVARDHCTLPQWEAGSYGLSVSTADGRQSKIKVASYYPYSGETPTEGITAELVYGGQSPNFDLSKVKGKIVFIDCPGKAVSNSNYYTVWGTYLAGINFPPSVHNAVDQT